MMAYDGQPRRALLPPAMRAGRALVGLTLASGLCLPGCRIASVRQPACPPAESGLTGRVVTAESGRPITNVLVETQPPTDGIRTDGRGCYAIRIAPAQGGKPVAEGRYTLVLQAPPAGQRISVAGLPAEADYDLKSVAVEVEYDGDPTELLITVPRVVAPDWEPPVDPEDDPMIGPSIIIQSALDRPSGPAEQPKGGRS